MGLGDVNAARPLTHDLFLSVLQRLDAEVNRVEITAINDAIFYARLILLQDDEEMVVDPVRPTASRWRYGQSVRSSSTRMSSITPACR